MSRATDIMHRCFPPALWSVRTTRLWLLTFAALLWFDLEWCMLLSFTALQMPELWVNTALAATLLCLPQMVWRMRRTQATVITALVILLECNLMYARTYFNAIPASSYLIAGNLADFTASVIDSLRWLDLIFAAIATSAWLTACSKTLPPDKPAERHTRTAYIATAAVLAIISGALLIRRGGLQKVWADFDNANYHSCRVPMYTIAGSLIHDLLSADKPLTPDMKAEVDRWLARQPRIEASADSTDIRNMVLIICESLESWALGITAEGKEITPNLNRLLADSTTFYAPNVLSQVGDGRSIDGQLLINAGMLPPLSGVYATRAATNTYHTLSKAFSEKRNARTYLLTVDKPATWNQIGVARAFGIDTLLTHNAWDNDERVGSRRKLGDRSFMKQIARRMADGEIWPEGTNAWIQIVTYSGHNPFILPESLDNLKLKGNYPATVRNYLTMAHYTDQGLGTLIDYLKSRPDYRNTLIVITGDHEGLASERASLAKACPLVNPQPMVPLIVLNAPQGRHFEPVMGQIDIYPTLLCMAGLTSYRWHGMGTPVQSPHFTGAAVSSQQKLVGDTTGVTPERLKHIMQARTISDRIITYNLLNPSGN